VAVIVERGAEIKDLLLEVYFNQKSAVVKPCGWRWSIRWREEDADRWAWFIRKNCWQLALQKAAGCRALRITKSSRQHEHATELAGSG
jgi:hypothetical protein